MTDEDKKKIIEVAEQLERALDEDTKADRPVTSVFSVGVWASARLRHVAQ